MSRVVLVCVVFAVLVGVADARRPLAAGESVQSSENVLPRFTIVPNGRVNGRLCTLNDASCQFNMYWQSLLLLACPALIYGFLICCSGCSVLWLRPCCNCCGGEEPSYGCCCVTTNVHFPGYTRGQIVATKVIYLLAALLIIAATCVAFIADQGIGGYVDTTTAAITAYADGVSTKVQGIVQDARFLNHTTPSDAVALAAAGQTYADNVKGLATTLNSYNTYRRQTTLSVFSAVLVLAVVGCIAALANLHAMAHIGSMCLLLLVLVVSAVFSGHFVASLAISDVCVEAKEYSLPDSALYTIFNCSDLPFRALQHELQMAEQNVTNAGIEPLHELYSGFTECPIETDGVKCKPIFLTDTILNCVDNATSTCMAYASANCTTTCGPAADTTVADCLDHCPSVVRSALKWAIEANDTASEIRSELEPSAAALLQCADLNVMIKDQTDNVCTKLLYNINEVVGTMFIVGILLFPATIAQVKGIKRFISLQLAWQGTPAVGPAKVLGSPSRAAFGASGGFGAVAPIPSPSAALGKGSPSPDSGFLGTQRRPSIASTSPKGTLNRRASATLSTVSARRRSLSPTGGRTPSREAFALTSRSDGRVAQQDSGSEEYSDDFSDIEEDDDDDLTYRRR